MVGFIDAVKTCALKKPFNFRDRAPRAEYWWYMLALMILSVIVNILILVPIVGAILYLVFSIFSFITTLSAAARRLHDIDRTAWWLVAPYGVLILGMIVMLLAAALSADFLTSIAGIIFIVGGLIFIVLLIFFVLPGTRGPNRFGPDPNGLALATPNVSEQATPESQSSPAQPANPGAQIPGSDGDFIKIEK